MQSFKNTKLPAKVLSVGRLYNTTQYRYTDVRLHEKPDRSLCVKSKDLPVLGQEEYFIFLGKKYIQGEEWFNILTSSGSVGWCVFDPFFHYQDLMLSEDAIVELYGPEPEHQDWGF